MSKNQKRAEKLKKRVDFAAKELDRLVPVPPIQDPDAIEKQLQALKQRFSQGQKEPTQKPDQTETVKPKPDPEDELEKLRQKMRTQDATKVPEIDPESKKALQVLSLPYSANPREVKKRFVSLVKKAHPDKYRDPDMQRRAKEIFLKIYKAYKTLKDKGRAN